MLKHLPQAWFGRFSQIFGLKQSETEDSLSYFPLEVRVSNVIVIIENDAIRISQLKRVFIQSFQTKDFD